MAVPKQDKSAEKKQNCTDMLVTLNEAALLLMQYFIILKG